MKFPVPLYLRGVVQKFCVLGQLRDLAYRSFMAMGAVVLMRHHLPSGVVGSSHAMLMPSGRLFHERDNM